MKKIYLALMCMAGFTLMTACGGKKDSKGDEAAADQQPTSEQSNKAEGFTGDDDPYELFLTVLKNAYGVTPIQVDPGFEFAKTTETGGSLFASDGVAGARVVAHFTKKDGTDVTMEEYNAYATKIFELTKSLSQDGKNVNGFSNADDLDGALTEKPIEKCIGKNEYGVDIWMTEWEFRKDDKFYRVGLSKSSSRGGGPEYIEFSMDESLQKPLKELMDEADRALEQAGY